MRLPVVLLFVPAAALFSAQDPQEKKAPGRSLAAQPFFKASPDPLRGTWMGRGGYVAQIIRREDKLFWTPSVPLESPHAGEYVANIFRAVDLPESKPVAVLSGVSTGAAVTFTGDGWTASIQGGRFKGGKGSEWFDLEKVNLDPPTLGAKPPAGAIVLFDGSSLKEWAKMREKSWLEEDGPARWNLLEGGVMEILPGAGSLISRRSFGDMRLHLEFRTLGGPTNSGIYLQSRYEVNINESFGRVDGNPCAGLDNCTAVKPRVRCSRPPLEWQTLDIDFKAPRFDAEGKKTAPARITVVFNGVTIYENQELGPLRLAAARLGEAAKGPVQLQEHGSPVQFRNIWVVE